MDDPYQSHEEDPRGVAAPDDPRNDSRDSVGNSGHFPDSEDAYKTCECGSRIEQPDYDKCQECRLNARVEAQSSPDAVDESKKSTTVAWVQDRIAVAAINASTQYQALAFASSGLKLRDLPSLPGGVTAEDTFDLVNDLEHPPATEHLDNWDDLPEIVDASDERGRELLESVAAASEAADNDKPRLYDQEGTPLASVEAVTDLQEEAAEAVWLVPAILYEQIKRTDDSGVQAVVRPKHLHCPDCAQYTLQKFAEFDENGDPMWRCTEADCGCERPGPVPPELVTEP